jgi:hypothetical protein
MEIDVTVQSPVVSVFPENLSCPVPQFWDQQKPLAIEDVLRWAEEVV